MTDLSGKTIDRYQIIEPIGQGGMASVYRAYDTRLSRDVAIKIIRTDLFGPAVLGELLKRFGSVQGMMSAPLSAWDGIKGIGNAKLAQVLAALELGRRAALPTIREKTIIKSTTQAAEYFTARLRGLADEHFRVVYLNRRGRLLDDALIAKGTVDTVHPPIRSIVARALQTNASALIVAHNHPSGAAQPSDTDKLLTRDLIAACHPLGIKVLEHVIVTENEHYSFADTGLLDRLGLETLAPLPVKR